MKYLYITIVACVAVFATVHLINRCEETSGILGSTHVLSFFNKSDLPLMSGLNTNGIHNPSLGISIPYTADQDIVIEKNTQDELVLELDNVYELRFSRVLKSEFVADSKVSFEIHYDKESNSIVDYTGKCLGANNQKTDWLTTVAGSTMSTPMWLTYVGITNKDYLVLVNVVTLESPMSVEVIDYATSNKRLADLLESIGPYGNVLFVSSACN